MDADTTLPTTQINISAEHRMTMSVETLMITAAGLSDVWCAATVSATSGVGNAGEIGGKNHARAIRPIRNTAMNAGGARAALVGADECRDPVIVADSGSQSLAGGDHDAVAAAAFSHVHR